MNCELGVLCIGARGETPATWDKQIAGSQAGTGQVDRRTENSLPLDDSGSTASPFHQHSRSDDRIRGENKPRGGDDPTMAPRLSKTDKRETATEHDPTQNCR